jgi:hypothetical protein
MTTAFSVSSRTTAAIAYGVLMPGGHSSVEVLERLACGRRPPERSSGSGSPAHGR